MSIDAVRIKPKPKALDKPFVAKTLKVVSNLNVAVYRWTGGLLGSKWRVGCAFPWGVPVLLLTTIGRKSGQPRTKPLLFIEEGDKVILWASQGGLAKHPLWYKNLESNPECEVQILRRKMKLRARTASHEEREAFWPRAVAHYPDLASYATWTDRVIPMVILDPTD